MTRNLHGISTAKCEPARGRARDNGTVLTVERVKTQRWRVALVVTAVAVVAFSREDPFAGLFVLVPIPAW